MRLANQPGVSVEALANIALRAARLAAAHIIKAYDRPDLIRVDQKATNDFVTNVDREAQQIITEAITRSYPEHQFLGEEDTETHENFHQGSEQPLWIIDPIDGTTNFSRQIPHFCVSLACSIKGKSSTPSSSTPSPMMSTSPQEAKALSSTVVKFASAKENKSLAASLPVRAASPRGQFETDTRKFARPLTKVTATSGSLEVLRLNSLILQLAASTACGSDGSIFGISQPGRSRSRSRRSSG